MTPVNRSADTVSARLVVVAAAVANRCTPTVVPMGVVAAILVAPVFGVRAAIATIIVLIAVTGFFLAAHGTSVHVVTTTIVAPINGATIAISAFIVIVALTRSGRADEAKNNKERCNP